MSRVKWVRWERKKNNYPAVGGAATPLQDLRKSLYKQAALLLLTVILTGLLIFAVTTAWYSNVLQTTGLVFEAAAWGLDGEVKVSGGPIQAAPGDSGIIELEITNKSEDIVWAGVSVSKKEMDEEMQKRLYFYVDTASDSNGERMERVYLTSTRGYTYSILGGGSLLLTQTNHNDAQLKWEWVYDVVGYYLLGTVSNGTAAVEEYLRPVVYDYDAATFDEKGSLLTVDGSTTVPVFLAQLSQEDGYAAAIRTDSASGGYYPVEVDDTGHGVWVYLCSRGEIEYASLYDTNLGEAAAAGEPLQQFKATLHVTGQQRQLNTVAAESAEELMQALADNSCGQIRLTRDLAVSGSIAVTGGREVLLDLNQHTLQSAADAVFSVEEGGSLTLMNGTLSGTTGQGFGVQTVGGEVSLSRMTVTGVSYAVVVQDQMGKGRDSKVRVSRCRLEAEQSAVLVRGNGAASQQLTQLIVEDSTVISKSYVGIIGDGAVTGTGTWGTDIQLLNSRVEGYWAGIYQPQKDSRMVIQNCEITGYTGIAVKGGTVRIENSAVTGTGKGAEPGFSAGGWTDTGDGVYVETNYGWPIAVEITGSSTVQAADGGQAVRQYQSDAGHAVIAVTGGVYSDDVAAFLPQVGGYRCQRQADGTYAVSTAE